MADRGGGVRASVQDQFPGVTVSQSDTGFESRWNEIKRIWQARENQWLYALTGFAAGALCVLFIRSDQSLLDNLFPEAIGILFTVVVIDRLNEIRTQRLLLEQLIREMGATDNGIATRAVLELGAKPDSKNCWLRSGVLRRKFFWGANLSRAQLFRADLESADFNSANMRDADLDEARLIGTGFAGANLEHAKFKRASLIGASMQEANLKYADFFCADLRGANFNDANLENAILIQAQFDATTKLPDGTPYDPQKGKVQLERFVSRSHPQFWRSSTNELSPAYVGQLHRRWQRDDP